MHRHFSKDIIQIVSKYTKRCSLLKELCFLPSNIITIDMAFSLVLGTRLSCYTFNHDWKLEKKKKNLAWLVHKMTVTISPLYISLKWDLYFLWPYFKANSIYFFDYLTINPVFCWDIKQISQFNNEYLALRHTWPFLWTRWLNHENHLNRYN